MTKYVLVFLLKGRPRTYVIRLTKELSRKFKILNVSNTISPHMTLKYMKLITSKNKLNELLNFLKNFTKNEKKFKFKLSGIGNFRKDVIFIDVVKNKQLTDFYKRLYEGLKKLRWIYLFGNQEGKNVHFHTTLATKNITQKFTKISDYLKRRDPNYELLVDQITLLKKNGSKWKPYKHFKLK